MDSPFWKGIIKLKDDFFKRGNFSVGNGEQTRFWEDTWLGRVSLQTEYPSLYAIASNKHSTDKHSTVHNVLGTAPINLPFRRVLIGDNRTNWLILVERLMRVNLIKEEDRFKWTLTSNGAFTVKSYYEDLVNGHTRYLRKYLWKLKIPQIGRASCRERVYVLV